MTWAVLVPIILMGILKIVVSSLPNNTVGWLIGKFELHSKLNEENVCVTVAGKTLEGEDKAQVIHDFNEATFVERYPVFPGYEQAYLHPENGGNPLVIDTKGRKKTVRLFVYIYDGHVNVVKQYKKKVVAYKLLSDSLQKTSSVSNRDLA
ncbi:MULTISPECIES: YfmQ family protein [Bacillaceae]|uniref:YfmQ family protein n=1 Tax=Bacillaceae TaxID=186817 RepID=UPI00101CEB25|nr:YfmQ family protein [Ectobacillus funiculus]